jgi:hypothetical protein
MDYLSAVLMSPAVGAFGSNETLRSCFEIGWLRADRPFYNVYPIAIELCQKTSLNMKWGDLAFPTRYLLLRFPMGGEPFGMKSAMLRVPSSGKQVNEVHMHSARMPVARMLKSVPLGGIVSNMRTTDGMWVYDKPDIHDVAVGETVAAASSPRADSTLCHETWASDSDGALDFLTKLVAFIGLLARGTDLITPAILSKDREEYDSTTDEARKKWLAERAARRQGRGFDVGRHMEIERASSPHWRCPHLALFHTGPGRTTPVLKVRSGCVVIPKDMSSVPTGYMGQEQPDEQPQDRPIKYRTPIPKRVRFRVLRRDGYRCRLCGLTAEDGVQLEVDHRVPVAKGGGNAESNLWTLCQPCNSGKSDSDLTLTTTTAE